MEVEGLETVGTGQLFLCNYRHSPHCNSLFCSKLCFRLSYVSLKSGASDNIWRGEVSEW